MKMLVRIAVACGLVAAVAVPSATGAKEKGLPSQSERNPFGIVIANFKKGTSPSAMHAAVAKAGGAVTSDLSKIDRLAAVSTDSKFASKLGADPNVTAVFLDKLWKTVPPDTSAGETGNNNPALGNGPVGPPDPWHNLTSFLGETNPEGILQWDDNRMNVPPAWSAERGAGVKVAVIDSGVQGSHKELLPNYDNQNSANTIPCNTLVTTFGQIVNLLKLHDCSSEDRDGHGTWVASRIVGAANGFASNGVAPEATVVGYKALAVGFGGFTSWITEAMIRACDADVDIINMSLGGFNDPFDSSNPFNDADELDTLVWSDAVNYCRSKGTAIFASAGNSHVRVNRVNVALPDSGVALNGVGRVDSGNEGIATVLPGTPALSKYAEDARGMIVVPGGLPGVIMVAATNNAIPLGTPSNPAAAPFVWPAPARGARDQLTYYSSYGSRIDIAAPGGARKYNVPRFDIGNEDILYGGWGTLGAVDISGDPQTGLCATAGSILTFACFKVNGAGFGWLQGTSMSSPNAAGVGALAIGAHTSLAENPNALLAHLQATARKNMTNLMVPNDPTNTATSATGLPCTTGFCHLDYDGSAISFASAYGAGMVNAGAAVATSP